MTIIAASDNKGAISMVTFAELSQAAKAAYDASGGRNSAPFHAINSAELNVSDTQIENGHTFSHDEAEACALSSLGGLCAYDAELASFFAPLGLRF
jgi:hypothetical protein